MQVEFSLSVSNIIKLYQQRTDGKDKLERLFSTLNHRAFSGELTAKWREAHLKELLAEMEIQCRELDKTDSKAATLF